MLFQQHCDDGRRFVNEVAAELQVESSDQAARIMTAVFHTLRETISIHESFHVISQLPMLIKAIYVNGWKPSEKNKIRSMDDFIECLMLQNPRATPQDFATDEAAIDRTKAVIRVLRKHVSPGEIDDVIGQLPAELTSLWETEEPHTL
jgi:uncharacterized protein (DUF2267 family)